MIPKQIIQTGPNNLPLLLQSAMVNLRLLNPDFNFKFFDDAMVDSFVAEQFPEYRATYRSFSFPIQRYDFFRYLAVYHFGGFYLDLDVFLARDLNPLLPHGSVFSFEELAEGQYFWKRFGMDWQVGNYAFGAEPGHPFLAAIIDNCLRAERDPEWVKPMLRGIPAALRDSFYVLNTTGPGLVSRTFAENPHLWKTIHLLFPDDVCDPRNWHHFGVYGVHNRAGSWRTPPTYAARCVERLWGHWNLKRTLREATRRGKTRVSCPAIAAQALEQSR
jgi:inositol phosphorylceramide mannosyltransferase catalytic subunit